MKTLIVLLMLAVPVLSQTTPPCDYTQGGSTIIGTIGCSGATPPPPPPPPPGTLQLLSTACGPGTTGTPYTCNMTATGGTPPYSWTSLGLPAGLSMNTGTGAISGTVAAAGSTNFTVSVSDKSVPVQTVTRTISVNITAAGACGPPAYACARTDYIAVNQDANTTVPPSSGCQIKALDYVAGNADYKPCNGHTTPCTPGMTEVLANPTLTTWNDINGVQVPASHASNLGSCSLIWGLNEIFTDPVFNNVQVLRVTDWGDLLLGCPLPTAYQGGSPAFDAHENYIMIAGCGVKWFDPVAFQIKTVNQQQGYVLDSKGNIWKPSPNAFASGAIDGAFFDIPTSNSNGAQVIQYQVTNGVISNTVGTIVTNMNYGIPCWSDVSNMTSVDSASNPVPMCGGWVQGTYPAGSTIVPVNNNGVYNTQVSGCSFTTPCICSSATPNIQYCHSFQLIHKDPCTTGTTEPNWVIPATNGVDQRPGVHISSATISGGVITYTYDPPGAGWTSIITGQQVSVTNATAAALNVVDQTVVSATSTTFTVATTAADMVATAQSATTRTFPPNYSATAAVIHDGTCDWADTWIPLRANWISGRRSDITDTIFNTSINNNQGQDSIGGCLVTSYNSNTQTYNHLNTCTGNAYNTVCTGGTGYQCTGGHWNRTFVGNVYEQNLFYASSDSTHTTSIPTSRYVMHGSSMSNNGTFNSTGENQCGLGDNNSALQCWFASYTVNGVPCTTAWCTGTQCSYSGGPCYPTVKANSQAFIQGGGSIWQIGTVNYTTDRTIIGTCCPGHAIIGSNVMIFNSVGGFQGGPFVSARQIVPWSIASPGPTGNLQFFDFRVGPCTLPGGWDPSLANCLKPQGDPNYGCANGLAQGGTGTCNGNSDCLPWPCYGRYNLVSQIGFLPSWDQHMDWFSNRGSDNTPLCFNTYVGQNVNGPYFQGIIGSIYYGAWPGYFPWQNEIVCIATDGSNKTFRQANQWHTANELWFYQNYGYPGGTSNDGKFYMFNSDMWCTVGGGTWPQYVTGNAVVNGAGAATSVLGVMCALPFQMNHLYNVGEYVAAVQSQPTGMCESMVFKVVTAGRSGKTSGGILDGTGAKDGSGTCSDPAHIKPPYGPVPPAGYPPAAPVPYWNCSAFNGGNASLGAGVGCMVKQTDGTAVFEFVGRSNQIPALFVVKFQ